MRILVGCETSGVMRRAFAALGHDVWSCDLLPAEDATNRHIVCDIRDVLRDGWDLMTVMHPPCTRLCNSGVRWLTRPPRNPPAGLDAETLEAWPELDEEQRRTVMWCLLDDAAALFSACWNAPIERIAIENPVMHRHAKERIVNYQRPMQTVQPWWFGEPFFKATSFYLKNLPKLIATDRLTPPKAGSEEHKHWSMVHRMPPSELRWKLRSKTYDGIADAAAQQWAGPAAECVA